MWRRSASHLLGSAVRGFRATRDASFGDTTSALGLVTGWTVDGTRCRVAALLRRSFNTSPATSFAGSKSSLLPEGISPRLASGLVAWFGVSTFGVASLIVLGGVTRLTRSGLSMTDWKFTGERPPTTLTDWEKEFDKYRQSPEFHRVNRSLSLEEFKFIYWMEYAHRMWGRCLGLIFGLPAFYFLAKGAVTPALGRRIALLFLMGGTQGLVGWWMVKSGLEEPLNETEIPRVSPYRLAAHLTSAFAIYSLLLWTTMTLRTPLPLLRSTPETVQTVSRRVRRWMLPLSGLVALTAFSGAFVAGNDAGRSYNSFPLMGEDWIPSEYFEQKLFTKEHLFENTAAVQLHHRVLALTTATSCVALWLKCRPLGLHPITKQYLMELAGMAVIQVSLGISALLYHVPTWLGSAHQAGALMLFSLVLGSLHTLRPVHPSTLSQALSKLGPGATALGVIAIAVGVTTMQDRVS